MIDPVQDPFSLQSRIARSEERIARQRQIVQDLDRSGLAEPAQRLLVIMKQSLERLRDQERGIGERTKQISVDYVDVSLIAPDLNATAELAENPPQRGVALVPYAGGSRLPSPGT